MEVVLEGEYKVKLPCLTSAMSASSTSGKLKYATCLRFFNEGDGSLSGCIMEAYLAYWLSWFVLPSGLEDGLNPYVFPMTIWLAKGEKLALAPLFLGLGV